MADITYIPKWTGFLYLSVVLHEFSLRIVGWSRANPLGAGSTFGVFLPARSGADARATGEASGAGDCPGGSGKMLVVDDDSVLRDLARAVLERYGYVVLLAEDGPRTLALLEREAARASLVLLDMTMSIMGGDEVYHRIHASSPEIPVVASSGYVELTEEQQVGMDGLADFICKPCTPSHLAGKFKRVLKERRAAGRR